MSRSDDHWALVAYESLADDVYRYIARRVPDRFDAEDILAQTFEGALKSNPDSAPRHVRPYLFRVARNKVADYWETQAGLQKAMTSLLAEHSGSDGRLRRGGSRRRFARQPDDYDQSGIVAAFRSLPRADQEVIGLADLDGLNGPEAALLLGVSPEVYRQRLSRARNKLRDLMEIKPPEPPMFASTSSGS